MNTIRNYFRAINPSATKLGVLTAFSLGVIGVASVVMPSSISASTLPYNDPSNIVNGGVTSVSSVISHYNSNNPSDIQSIYKAFGWTSATDFQKAVSGTLKSDGTLTVNGKIVADQASAIGRKGPADGYKDTTPKTINGKAYYMTPLSYILGFYHMSSTTSFVQMNGNTPQFVVMTDCGNAVTVRTPQYSCDMLNAKKVSDTNYQFTSNVTAKNGATLSKVVYDFGDGSATVTEASASTVVSHTYDSNKPGTYTAKVTAYFTYYGQTEVSTASACEKPITIPKPATPIYECSALSASLIDTKTNTYHFVVTYKAASGAVFKGGNINFGDNLQGTFAANMLTIDHAYLQPGTYTAVATVTFDVNGQTKTVTSANCQAKITIPQPPVTPVFICTNLTSTLVGANTYSFTANAQVSNATLVSGSFDFGDGQTASNITPAAGNPNQIVSNGHSYPSSPSKTYTIVATLTFSVNGKTQTVTGGNCQTQIAINQPPVECKPGIPVGSPQCTTTPPTLPSTGPEGILGSAFGLSSIVAAGTHYARSRRDLLTALLKRR